MKIIDIDKESLQSIGKGQFGNNGKKPEPKNWILTAYSKESSNVTLAPPDND